MTIKEETYVANRKCSLLHVSAGSLITELDLVHYNYALPKPAVLVDLLHMFNISLMKVAV